MQHDYTYPSVYLAYLFMALMVGLAAYWLVRSRRDGYWGEHSEDAKYHMFDDDDPARRKP